MSYPKSFTRTVAGRAALLLLGTVGLMLAADGPATAGPCKGDGAVCHQSRSCCGTSGNNGLCVKAPGDRFGVCCTPAASCAPGTCGTVSDGCGGTLDCGGCDAGEVCDQGMCVAMCLPSNLFSLCFNDPSVCCSGTCASVIGGPPSCCEPNGTPCDLSNPGACCSDACTSGVCACAAGQTDCGDVIGCVDEQTDTDNCGACGNHCATGAVCNAGVCACLAGNVNCGAVCVDLSTDPNHCGTCDTACPSGHSCVSGQCN